MIGRSRDGPACIGYGELLVAGHDRLAPWIDALTESQRLQNPDRRKEMPFATANDEIAAHPVAAKLHRHRLQQDGCAEDQ
jgi:hypothetical protein